MEAPNRYGSSHFRPVQKPVTYQQERNRVEFFRPKVHSHAELFRAAESAVPGEGREIERQRTAIYHALILYDMSRAVAYERMTRDRGFRRVF